MEEVTVIEIKLVFGITEVEMVASSEETPISAITFFFMIELFKSSVKRFAMLLVEVRLLYTVVELPFVVTTKTVFVRYVGSYVISVTI